MMLPAFVRIVLRVPIPPMSLNVKHHPMRAHRERKLRNEATIAEARLEMHALRVLHMDPRAPKRITFVRHGTQLMDHDNLMGSLKPYIDGLKGAAVIDDDKPPEAGGVHVIDVRGATQVINRRWGGLVITIELLPPATQEAS